MGKLDIVGLGMSTLDVLVRMKDMPNWDHGGQLSGFAFDGGGPVATAMVAAARLGARVGYIGTAGTDESAEIKLRAITRDDVDISRLVRYEGPENSVVLVCVREDDGERVFAGMGRFHHNPLKIEQLDREYITSADYLHLDGAHYDAALQAAKWMREAGKTVVYDGSRVDGSNRVHLNELMGYVDVLIGGSGFVPALTGKADIKEAGLAALELGPKIVVQTEGLEGSYTFTKDEEFHTPAFVVDAVDTTGCGDVFHGAYIVGLLQGWSPQKIALFSSSVSAIKATQLGGRKGIPTFDRTIEFMRERGVWEEAAANDSAEEPTLASRA